MRQRFFQNVYSGDHCDGLGREALKIEANSFPEMMPRWWVGAPWERWLDQAPQLILGVIG